MITLPTQVLSNLATERMGRVITVSFGASHPQRHHPSLRDPVFLPDFVRLMPDQEHELSDARGRDQ